MSSPEMDAQELSAETPTPRRGRPRKNNQVTEATEIIPEPSIAPEETKPVRRKTKKPATDNPEIQVVAEFDHKSEESTAEEKSFRSRRPARRTNQDDVRTETPAAETSTPSSAPEFQRPKRRFVESTEIKVESASEPKVEQVPPTPSPEVSVSNPESAGASESATTQENGEAETRRQERPELPPREFRQNRPLRDREDRGEFRREESFRDRREGRDNNRDRRHKNKNNRNRDFVQFEPTELQLTTDPEKIAAAQENWKELRRKNINELYKIASELEIPEIRFMRKQALIYKILAAQAGEDVPIYTEGVLDLNNDGSGFLRNPDHSYMPGPDDVYVPQSLVRRFELKTGDTISGQVRPPSHSDKYFPLYRIESVNFGSPEFCRKRVHFDNLTPLHPRERLNLEFEPKELTTRIINLFAPIGKGQRGIILAPPRTGKTVLLQHIANAIEQNHPEVKLMVLLIDERPEEVTEMKRKVKGEVLSSTFDEPPERHVQVADMVIEKAKRLVEHGQDVVILLDSITRFARANNVAIPHSGKILSGGVDAMAMQRPKRFFGAARKIENGGSLTIIGTALIETGSKMDEVIFEEFKGTGNMELVLDRRISEKRVWPAVDIFKSGTRKEEYLLTEEELRRVWILRRYMQDFQPLETIEFMRDKMAKSKTNEAFLAMMNG